MKKVAKKSEPKRIIYGFKGTDANCKCRDQIYKLKKLYSINNGFPISCCNNGFHLCTKPLEVLTYYGPIMHDWQNGYQLKNVTRNRFFRVEGSGKSSFEVYDSKVAVEHIKLVKELSLADLAKAHIKLKIDNKYEIETKEFVYTAFQHQVAAKHVAIMMQTECISIDPLKGSADASFRWAESQKSYVQSSGMYSFIGMQGSHSLADVSGDHSIIYVDTGTTFVEVTGNDCIVICRSSSRIKVRGNNCLVYLDDGEGYVDGIPGTTVIWRRRFWYALQNDVIHRAVIEKAGVWAPSNQDNTLAEVNE